jgi:hypothetical protein
VKTLEALELELPLKGIQEELELLLVEVLQLLPMLPSAVAPVPVIVFV